MHISSLDFMNESSVREIEEEHRIRVKHRSTGHEYEFQIGPDWKLLFGDVVIHPNQNSDVDQSKHQSAARIAAQEIVKMFQVNPPMKK
jgi:hypothetical protein